VSSHRNPKRRRFTPVAMVAGLAGTVAIALSMSGSLSGLVATITNSTNTAASAAIAISETSGGSTCNSYDTTATCSTINKYGGTTTPLVPGGSQTVTVQFANTGNVAVSTSTLTPGTCVATSTGSVGSTTPTTPNTTSGNLCSVLNIAVYKGATATGTALYNGSAASFGSAVTLSALAAGANQSYTFVASLPSSATTAVQGQQISQPLTWTFNQ
jgi:hypothetical protein